MSIKMNMDEMKKLQRYYDFFIDVSSGWDFFVGLKNYVKVIKEDQKLNVLSQNMIHEYEDLKCEEKKLESKSVEEILFSKGRIYRILKKNGLADIDPIKTIVSDMNAYIGKDSHGRKIYMSGHESDNLDRFLFDVCRNIPEERRFDLFGKFVDKDPETRNIYGNFLFSKTLKARREFTEKLEHRRKNEIWDDWFRVSAVPKFIECPSIGGVSLENNEGANSHHLISARFEYEKTRRDDSELTKIIPEYRNSVRKVHFFLIEKLNDIAKDIVSVGIPCGKKSLSHICLVTESIAVKDVIYLVLNKQYQMPFRFSTKNNQGKETAIKLLHNIAYLADASGKMVSYSKRNADNINNGIFRNSLVLKYMKTNNLEKPTLVRKSEDGKILVLGSGFHIESILTNKVPSEHQYLYKDKRK
jgi:hypothetical protein